MKQLIIFLIAFSISTPSFAKNKNKELTQGEKATVGLFLIFCPMCLPAVAQELGKDRKKEEEPKKPVVRTLASKTEPVSKKNNSSK